MKEYLSRHKTLRIGDTFLDGEISHKVLRVKRLAGTELSIGEIWRERGGNIEVKHGVINSSGYIAIWFPDPIDGIEGLQFMIESHEDIPGLAEEMLRKGKNPWPRQRKASSGSGMIQRNDIPTLKMLKKQLKEEEARSYEPDNMSEEYDRSLERIALLETMIKRKLHRKPSQGTQVAASGFYH